jgi:hypothetical protein
MSRDLFIYYRVPAAHTETMQKKIVQMQGALREQWPVSTGLKRRPELKDGCETWMEIYTQVPDDFSSALELAVAQAQVLALTEGHRHTETFMDIAACA